MLKLTEILKTQDLEADLFQHQVFRPWGSFAILKEGPGFKIKRLEVIPQGRLSLQFHLWRSEHWLTVAGEARVTRGEKIFLLRPQESTFIPRGMLHRLENPGTVPVVIFETQNGAYLGEDDIVRLDDIYGREISPVTAPSCLIRK